MKNLLLIFMMLFAVDSIAQLDQREKGDVVSPALNKNPNLIQKTGWTIEAIDPINDTLCSVTPSSDNLTILTANVCNARVYQDINSADIRKARFAKETMTALLKLQSLTYVKITLNVYKKAATTGTLTLLRTRSLEHNSNVPLLNKKITFDVVTEDLNFVPNAELADSLRIEFTFEPTVVFPAGVAKVEVNDFRVFSSPMNYSPVLYNVNQTQSETLLNVGNLTQTTDLSTFAKENQVGGGIYALSTEGITMLRDADVVIRYNLEFTGGTADSENSIFLNGQIRDRSYANSTYTKTHTSEYVGKVGAGQKITFNSVTNGTASTSSNVQILATVSVPAVATNKYREPVTKYLSANITATTADIADFKFTDLVVGDRYEVTVRPRFGETATDNNYLRAVHSGVEMCLALTNIASTVENTCRFIATSTSLTFETVLNGMTLRGGTVGDYTNYSYVTLKRIDSVMQAYFLESNIEKDVEQFHTDERKICDRCYKGKALYKKCFTDMSSGYEVVSSGVTEIARVYGNVFLAAERQVAYPFTVGADVTYLERTVSTGRVFNFSNVARTGNACVEYTKD